MLENLSMYESIVKSSQSFPKDKAIYYEGKKISFRKLVKLVDQTADILVNRLNIKRNDVVMISQPNIPDALIIFYACNKIGAIANFVHPFTPFNQIKTIVKKNRVKVAFLFEQRIAKEVERYREFADSVYVTRIENFLPFFKKIYYHIFMNFKIRKKLGKYHGGFNGFKYFHKLKPTGKKVETLPNKNKDCSVLLHSGSTTGDPKTIMLNDSAFNFIVERAPDYIGTSNLRNHGMLSVLPSFHGFGFCVTMHLPLANGFCCILLPKFTSKNVCKVMNRTCVSIICGVPSMYETLLSDSNFVHHKKIKNLFINYCGGDSTSQSLKDRFDETMKNGGSTARLFEGYGLTEAIAVNCLNTFEHNKDGSLGYPIRNVEFKIIDDNGAVLKANEVGEIAIKTGALMLGYYNDPEETKNAIKDGWLYTGDLGYIDDDGFIFFKNRKKRVVKVSGVMVFPSEIEKLIESLPEVSGAVAVQIPDDKLIHAIKVFVVAKFFDEEGMKNKIMDICRKYLIRWSVPKEIEFVDSLPKTLLNKTDFKKLQQEENARRGL